MFPPTTPSEGFPVAHGGQRLHRTIAVRRLLAWTPDEIVHVECDQQSYKDGTEADCGLFMIRNAWSHLQTNPSDPRHTRWPAVTRKALHEYGLRLKERPETWEYINDPATTAPGPYPMPSPDYRRLRNRPE